MNTKVCSYCGSNIAAQAILCPTCKSYQSAWRNSLLFIAGLTGFITILAGVATYVFHEATDLYKQLFRQELNVLELETEQTPFLKITMQNNGVGPVYASELVVSWRGGSYRYPIGKVVALNSIETIDNLPNDPFLGKFTWLHNKSGVVSDDILHDAVIMGDHFDSKTTCILVGIFDKNNADLLRMSDFMSEHGEAFTRDDGNVSINYFSAHSGTQIHQEIPVVVGFLKNPTPECQKTAGQTAF